MRNRRTKRQNPTTFVWLFWPPRRQAKSGFFLPKLLLIAVSSPPLPTPPPPAPEQGRGERFCLRGARCTPAVPFPPHPRLRGCTGEPRQRGRGRARTPPRRPPDRLGAGPPTPPSPSPAAAASLLFPRCLRLGCAVRSGAERRGAEEGGRCAGLRQNNGRGCVWGGVRQRPLRLRGQGPLLGPAAALRTAPLRSAAAQRGP